MQVEAVDCTEPRGTGRGPSLRRVNDSRAGASGRLDDEARELRGVSVESAAFTWRIDQLRRVQAAVRFLSVEPLLGPIPELPLEGIDWVIVGGESGRHPRPMREQWVIEIRDQCRAVGVPFFFKQWGTSNKKLAGRVLEGRTWDEMPGRDVDCAVL